MHIPFSMSDEPDLGDEFKSHYFDEQTVVDAERIKIIKSPKTYSQQLDDTIKQIISQSIKMRDEAYSEGFNEGYQEALRERT